MWVQFSLLTEGFEHTLPTSQPDILTISLWFGHGDVILDSLGDCYTTIQLSMQLSLDKYKAGRRRLQLNSSIGQLDIFRMSQIFLRSAFWDISYELGDNYQTVQSGRGQVFTEHKIAG